MHTNAPCKYALKSHRTSMKKIGFISVPDNTKAILWDMDGVLIDSLGLDLTVTNELLNIYFGEKVILSREYITSIFGYTIPEFWGRIFKKIETELGIQSSEELCGRIVDEYTAHRLKSTFSILPGVERALADAKKSGIQNAVVSNNPVVQIQEILSKAGIIKNFDLVVGNDSVSGLKNKPEPDMYVYALKQLKIGPEDGVVVEDSLIGVEAGKRAGCSVIAIATRGSTTSGFENMRSFRPDNIYQSLSK